MQVWKKSLIGAAMSLALVGGAVAQVGAQAPASITAHVELCTADTSSCEVVVGQTVTFDVNGGASTQNVVTNDNGDASIEVSTGDSVVISVDPAAIPGATLANDTPESVSVDSVAGDEQPYNFIFVQNATETPTTVPTTAAPTTAAPTTAVPTTAAPTTAANALPSTGVGPQDGSGSTGTLLLAVAGSAIAAGAAGVAMRKRSLN